MPLKVAPVPVVCGSNLMVSVLAVDEATTTAPVVVGVKLTFWPDPPAANVRAVVPVIEPLVVPVPPLATAMVVPFQVPVVTTPVLAVMTSPL